MECCAVNVSSIIDAEKLHELRGKYQIPENIHTRLPTPGEPTPREQCCSPNSPMIGVYEAYLLGGLRFPFNAFAREVLHRLGVAPKPT